MAHRQVPRIILRGDQERASHMSREGMRQLDILKNLMGFQNLKQDVRKIRYTDGSEIICRSVFGIEDVQIYVPKVIEAEIFGCFIELLTYGIEGDCVDNLNYIPGGIWNEESCIKEKGFCLTPDEECNIELKAHYHPWGDKRNHHVSQCRYVYTEGDTTRKVSLFHYDSYPTLLTLPVYKIIRVKGHQNSPDLVLKFLKSGKAKAHYYGALSKDLKTLYVSLFVERFGILPRNEWYMDYSKYENIDGKWECTKSGITPKGMPFRDNAIDRLGRCGCWHYDDEFITYNHEKQGVNCLIVTDGWIKNGTNAEAKYKTFDIETETFVETEKVVGLHLNPVTEEFVTCKALPGTDCFYKLASGAPNQFLLHLFSCQCVNCPAPYDYIIATHERNVNYRLFYGGWSREYTLFSGLETYPPLWDTFFYDGLQVQKMNTTQLVGNCPTFIPKRNHTCDGTAYDFLGGEMRALNVPFTSCVYAGHVKVGTEIVESGYSYPGNPAYISGVPCNDYTPPVRTFLPHRSPCGHNITSVTQAVNVNDMELLSPFEMTLQAGDQIGNTFISYDDETDYLLRGIHYKQLGGEWTWKIYARLIGHEGSPYNCPEKDITNELKDLLSAEYFYNIETIIFTGEAS